jgi:dihydrodipicolinate synthase/N-acetylneuraminate lyase
LPIVIYNVVSDNPILPSAMKKIANIDNIIGIKQSIGGRGIHGLTDMIAECGDKISIFGAQDDLMYISYELGAVGAISAIIALFPELCVQQWNAVQARNYDLAKEIHYRILPVWRTIEGRAFPGRIKAALNLLGRNVGKARKPILETTGIELENIKRALIQSSFL